MTTSIKMQAYNEVKSWINPKSFHILEIIKDNGPIYSKDLIDRVNSGTRPVKKSHIYRYLGSLIYYQLITKTSI